CGLRASVFFAFITGFLAGFFLAAPLLCAFAAAFSFAPPLAFAAPAFFADLPRAFTAAFFFALPFCFACDLLLFLVFGLAMTPHYRQPRKRSRHDFVFRISCN